MRTRKSKLGSDVLKAVRSFFDSAEFRERPDKVKEYVRWALAYGGPAYYETPVPKSYALGNGGPNHSGPVRFCCSRWRCKLTSYGRNRQVFYAHNLSCQLPRHTLLLQRGLYSIRLWDQCTRQGVSMPLF